MEQDSGEHEVKPPEAGETLASPADGQDGGPAATEASDRGEEKPSAPDEPPAKEAPPASGDAADGLSTGKPPDGDGEGTASPEGSAAEDVGDGDGSPRLHPETSESEGSTSSAQEEEEGESEEEELAAAAADDAARGEEGEQKRELSDERDKAFQRNCKLQLKVAAFLSKKSRDIVQLETVDYEKSVGALAGLKQQLAAEAEAAQQKTEELRLESQEKSEKVKKEWQEFVALKRDIAVTVLSRSLGKATAQANVESILTAEQLKQDALTERRLAHMKLRTRIHRLDSKLREIQGRHKDHVQLLVAKLRAARLEHNKRVVRLKEDSERLRNNISRSLEVLTNVKEKLFWTQRGVEAKREQLLEVEAAVRAKREALTTTKEEGNAVRWDNQRLKGDRGLLGNRLLLEDYEDFMDACDRLEGQLGRPKPPPPTPPHLPAAQHQ